MKIETVPSDGEFVDAAELCLVSEEELVLRKVEFRNCLFRRCRMKRAVFDQCYFDECKFEDSEMSLCKIGGSSFSRCKMVDSGFDGIIWHAAGISFDCHYINCRLRYGSFFGMKIKNIIFDNCHLEEVVFTEANLEGAQFPNCDLRGALFSNTNLAKASFVGAQNYSIDITGNKCKGARFSLPEAINLLSPFGIRIE